MHNFSTGYMAIFIDYISILFLSILLSGIITPMILRMAYRKNLFDEPSEVKVHTERIPRLGGVVFAPVICFGMLVIFAANSLLGESAVVNSFMHKTGLISFGLCALFTTYFTGIADDIIGIRYSGKFILQIIASIFLLAAGLGVTDLDGLLWISDIPDWAGFLLTVFYTIFVMNAMNLIDGIDGLCSGLASVALLIYGMMFVLQEDIFGALLAFASFGVIIPFYYFNVFGKRESGTKLFMGDTGSLTLGMIIVFLGLRIVNSSGIATTPYDADIRMLVVLSPLMIPCMDVVRVYFFRLRRKRNPFLADKSHIHHKLLDSGMGQRTVMCTIVCASMALCVVNILFSRWINFNFLLLADILIFIIWNIIISRKINKAAGSPVSGK